MSILNNARESFQSPLRYSIGQQQSILNPRNLFHDKVQDHKQDCHVRMGSGGANPQISPVPPGIIGRNTCYGIINRTFYELI